MNATALLPPVRHRRRQPACARVHVATTPQQVVINSGEADKEYKGNAISTTKYNLLTFFPKALFEQYR